MVPRLLTSDFVFFGESSQQQIGIDTSSHGERSTVSCLGKQEVGRLYNKVIDERDQGQNSPAQYSGLAVRSDINTDEVI